MNIFKRFERLTLWNKLAAIGAVASIIGLVYIFFPKTPGVNIELNNQQGGITAQNVTITNYFQSSTFLKEKENLDKDLKQKYPFGYAVLGVDGKKIFIPNDLNFTEQFNIEWPTAGVEYLTDAKVAIQLPKIIYKPLNTTLDRLTLVVSRRAGYQRKLPMTFAQQKFSLFIEVMENQRDFVILVIGFKK